MRSQVLRWTYLAALVGLVGFLPVPLSLAASSYPTHGKRPAPAPLVRARQPSPLDLSRSSTRLLLLDHACRKSFAACSDAMLGIINRDRREHSRAPLRLNRAQSQGNWSCPGSYGHSVAMASSASIWHSSPKYPRASFPHNLCVPFTHAGENVGMFSGGQVPEQLHGLDTIMMREPHTPSTCASTVNHACNILNPAFRSVGIGILHVNGATWLTEDFLA